MEFIKSNKGSSKLCYEGHTYTKKKENKVTVAWECSKRRSQQCKGALITDNPITEVKSVREHSHDNDPFHVQGLKVRAQIKSSVEANRGLPGQIIADKMVSQPVEVRLAAGTTQTLKRGIRRQKRGTAPTNPETITSVPVPIPEPYSTNLIYDNESSTSRILVYASSDGLQLLQSASTWFMDGTHSTAPQQFTQVFTVRVPLGETSATAAYALLPSKEEDVTQHLIWLQTVCKGRL